MTDQRTYRASQAAARLFISASHLRTLTRTGFVPSSAQTPGGQRLYTEDDLREAARYLSGTSRRQEREQLRDDEIQLTQRRLGLAWQMMTGPSRVMTIHGPSARDTCRLAIQIAAEAAAAPMPGDARVLVIDGTIGGGTLARLVLGRAPVSLYGECTLVEWVDHLDDRDRSPEIPARPLADFTVSDAGIDMLLSPENPDFAQDMMTSEYLRLLDICRSSYDLILIAAGPAEIHSPHATAWIRGADLLVMSALLVPDSLEEMAQQQRRLRVCDIAKIQHVVLLDVPTSPLDPQRIDHLHLPRPGSASGPHLLDGRDWTHPRRTLARIELLAHLLSQPAGHVPAQAASAGAYVSSHE
jgi:DNA-binding transcriptional MerR regulator